MGNVSRNPFTGGPIGATAGAAKPLGMADLEAAWDSGQLLTPAEQIKMATAPRKGTVATVRAYGAVVPIDPVQHMYETFDDGQRQYIFRGGPQAAPEGGWRLHAEVTPAAESKDAGKGGRTLFTTFLPGQTADQAVQPMRVEAARVNASDQPYLGVTSNSNLVIGDGTEKQFGHRVGDLRTWGYNPDRDVPPPTVYPPTMPIW